MQVNSLLLRIYAGIQKMFDELSSNAAFLLPVIIRTAILVPYDFIQATAIHLKIGRW